MSQANIEPKIIYLKDYTPPEYLIEHVELDFDLNSDVTIVKSKLTIIKNPSAKTDTKQLVLNGEELELREIILNNKALSNADYTLDPLTLTLKNVPDQCTLQITTEINPAANTALSGLYKSSNIYCTQCEAEGFRRITYFLDRPDVMATYKVTIHAEKRAYPVLLANGNLVDYGSEDTLRHFAVWEDPFKKPCYLFAMVAGDLVAAEDNFITMSGRLVKCKVYVERANLSQTAHALEALKKSMLWDEQAYGREYDLDIYMIVAVNDFNMGAMENKGLNIFNSKYILASPQTATDVDFEHVDIVVGHEYFHNWSGNRVTCRDWFQLSLKEGFTVFREQQFTQYITQSPVVRIDEVKGLITRQFAEDAGPLAHPVRPDSYAEINNFYTATIYEKGAEVIRMLHTLLGADRFRIGTDLYFSRFDGQAVTTDDFVAALQESSGVDLVQFKLWYTQAGTPEVSVLEEYDAAAQKYTLKLAQKVPDTQGQTNKQPMHIPITIGLLDDNGTDIPLRENVLSLTKPEQEFVFENIHTQPHLSILRNFSAPVKIQREVSDKELAFLLNKDNDDFNRWFAGQKLYTNILLGLIADVQNNRSLMLPEILLNTFGSVLVDTQMNVSLKAEILQPPSTQLLIDSMQVADPDAIYKAKRFMVTTLAEKFRNDLHNMYETYTTEGPYKYTAEDVAKRACKNTILGYIASTRDAKAIDLANYQYNHANNMTDCIAALAALSSINCNERIEALMDFYNKWATNPLVVNKWLAIQATADLDATLEQVQGLLKHAAFDIKNPNKVYALIGGFGTGNPVKFHAANGSGYKFLTDVVIELNAINPQVAARMLQPLTPWQKFAEFRQDLMCSELIRIRQTPNLSPDVLDIVTRSLDQYESK